MTTPDGIPQPLQGSAVPVWPVQPANIDIEQVRDILPSLIDSLSDAVVVLDRERRVVAANRRYVEAFGVRRAQAAGAACHDALNCPEVAAGNGPGKCAACEVFQSRQAQKQLRSIPDPTGAQRRWETTFNPIVDVGGVVTHVVEVWRDITDRSQLEVQLSHSERLASLGILAAGVGHEINNPLASVLAGVESLSRWVQRGQFDAKSAAEAAETLQTLEREIARCRETTDKLMLLARPYSTKATWVNLNQAVIDTLALLRFQMRKQGIHAVLQLDPELPAIWARDTGMRAVCMNLMMNALQAMAAGGTITLSTSRTATGLVLVIEDSGPGIATQHLDRIWDPFFTTKPIGQGTGLGLSITQRIVTRHGGRIRAESAPGRGAKFVVELPIEGSGGG